MAKLTPFTSIAQIRAAIRGTYYRQAISCVVSACCLWVAYICASAILKTDCAPVALLNGIAAGMNVVAACMNAWSFNVSGKTRTMLEHLITFKAFSDEIRKLEDDPS